MSATLARLRQPLPVTVREALDLWCDPARWPAFVEGLAAVERVDGDWPAAGAALEWRSGSAGRGHVTETVSARTCSEERSALTTTVEEEALTGTQQITFSAAQGGGCHARLDLDYALRRGGLGMRVADLLFIRRSLSSSFSRTLAAFSAEAAEYAAGPRSR